METVLSGLLENMAVAVRQGKARRSSSVLWGKCLAVIECDIPRKVDWKSKADCMLSPVIKSNSDGLSPLRTSEGARALEYVARFQAVDVFEECREELCRRT